MFWRARARAVQGLFKVLARARGRIGRTDRATTFLPLLVYRNAFENGRYGYAAAITVVAFALTLVVVATQIRVLRRGRLDG